MGPKRKLDAPKGDGRNKVSGELAGLPHVGTPDNEGWLGKAICDQNVKTPSSRSAYVLLLSTM